MDTFFLYIKNKRYQSKNSKGLLKMKLAQIDASSYTTDVQEKTTPECGTKEAEKAKEYCTLAKN